MAEKATLGERIAIIEALLKSHLTHQDKFQHATQDDIDNLSDRATLTTISLEKLKSSINAVLALLMFAISSGFVLYIFEEFFDK